MKIYRDLAQLILAIEKSNKQSIDEIIKSAPTLFGIDSGTKFDYENSTSEKIILNCSFHHKNPEGYYDGWEKHDIIITPSLFFGISLKITGSNKDGVKDYLKEIYTSWLNHDTRRF